MNASPGIWSRPIQRERLLAIAGLLSLLTLAATWSAPAWSWGSALLFASFGAGLETLRRLRRGDLPVWLPALAVVVVNRIDRRLLQTETHGFLQGANQTASMALSMALGIGTVMLV